MALSPKAHIPDAGLQAYRTVPDAYRVRVRTLPALRTFEYAAHRAGLGPVAGVDEAGRGACCGPISIAACILPPGPLHDLDSLTDSKKLTAAKREELYDIIVKRSLAWSVVLIGAEEIDQRGIQAANVVGMRRAVARLGVRPGFVFTDAVKVPGMEAPMLSVIGGDGALRCVAAASVLAKVTRDRYMDQVEQRYPGYGLAQHKGYGTASHMAALEMLGPTPEHRYTYRNVAAVADAAQPGNRRSNTARLGWRIEFP